MRRNLLHAAVVAAGVMLGLAPPAGAMPGAWYEFNGQQVIIPQNAWTQNENGDWVCNFKDQNNGQYLVSGAIEINGDPQIIYGVAATNFSNSTASFAFGFTDNFPVLSGPDQVYGSTSASVTDGGGDGISLQPTAAKLQLTDLNGTNMGVDVGNGFTAGPGLPGESYDAGFDSRGPMAGPVGNWTQMNTVLSFTLTGGDDVATLNGSAVILPSNPIPEPASALLLGLGLMGFAAWRLRRGLA